MWLGWYLRQYDQTTVDSEDLYHILNTDPVIQENENAKNFEYKAGKINFRNISFKHYAADRDDTIENNEE